VQLDVHEFETRDAYKEWLSTATQVHVRGHAVLLTVLIHALQTDIAWSGNTHQQPTCLVQRAAGIAFVLQIYDTLLHSRSQYLGGCDNTLQWARSLMIPSERPAEVPVAVTTDNWNPAHAYEYDLIVIGGGSGGETACESAC
jgi:hypothetical protein